MKSKITLEEFIDYENTSYGPVEYIDGYLVEKTDSSRVHKQICSRISIEIDRYLKEKPYEVFSQEIEVILGENIVKPDIFIVYKKKESENNMKVNKSRLLIPDLVFEIVSQITASLDQITKMNLYAEFGIKEYNLVYEEGVIHQYILNDFGRYYPKNSYKNSEIYKSFVLEDLSVDMENIFKNLNE